MNDQDYNNRFTTREMGDQANPRSNTQNATMGPVGEGMHQDQTVPDTDAGAAVDLEKEPLTGDAVISLGAPVAEDDRLSGLLNPEESEGLRHRWNEIQGMFVDEPRAAVQQADALVSEVMEQITRMFTSEHSSLESQWTQGDDVSTEDLRKVLQRYRSFFNRLVV